MHLIRTQLAGKPNQQGKPTVFASISRLPGGGTIVVELSNDPMQSGNRYPIPADGEAGALAHIEMAQFLQRQLDGYKGTNSEVRACLTELQRFADQTA